MFCPVRRGKMHASARDSKKKRSNADKFGIVLNGKVHQLDNPWVKAA